jgi:AraC family transcriptional regulator
MVELIRPDELPAVIQPVEILLASDELGFHDDVVLRSYAQAPSEVEVPPLKDYGLSIHQGAVMTMDRRVDGGPWRSELLVPGTVSVLTRAAPSEWHWSAPTAATHLYLSRDLLTRVAADVFDRDIADVELRDVLNADDEILRACIGNIAEEVRTRGLGGQLLVDSFATQACVQLLRRYATITFREERARDAGFSRLQAKSVARYIEEHLDQKLRLADLAQVAHVSANQFMRQFKLSFGCPPHVYVIRRRLEYAQRLLAKTHLPIKQVAAHTGFADQSHMSRAFQQYLRTTPGSFRDKSGS